MPRATLNDTPAADAAPASAATGAQGRSETPPPAEVAAALAARPDVDWVRLVYLAEVGSTNDVAIDLAASGAPDGTTVLAGRQTDGRGRRGRVWHSPRDGGLYLSLLLRGPQSPLLTLLAGVAAAEAIRTQTGVPAELKWPNDVVLAPSAGSAGERPRKVAGILAERLPAAAGEGAVVGIGVNVTRAAYPPELAAQAVSLEEASGRPVARGRLLAELLAGIRRRQAALEAGGSARLLDRWRQLSPSCRGAHVSWEGPAARRAGLTAGIADDGALLVECHGRTERIVGGELRWVRESAP